MCMFTKIYRQVLSVITVISVVITPIYAMMAAEARHDQSFATESRQRQRFDARKSRLHLGSNAGNYFARRGYRGFSDTRAPHYRRASAYSKPRWSGHSWNSRRGSRGFSTTPRSRRHLTRPWRGDGVGYSSFRSRRAPHYRRASAYSKPNRWWGNSWNSRGGSATRGLWPNSRYRGRFSGRSTASSPRALTGNKTFTTSQVPNVTKDVTKSIELPWKWVTVEERSLGHSKKPVLWNIDDHEYFAFRNLLTNGDVRAFFVNLSGEIKYYEEYQLATDSATFYKINENGRPQSDSAVRNIAVCTMQRIHEVELPKINLIENPRNLTHRMYPGEYILENIVKNSEHTTIGKQKVYIDKDGKVRVAEFLPFNGREYTYIGGIMIEFKQDQFGADCISPPVQ